MAWQTPKTNWRTPDGVSYADFNRIEGNIALLRYGNNVLIEDTEGHFTAGNVEDALHELYTNTTDGKTAIAQAITDMGQTASGNDSYTTLATKIRNISDDANAAVGDVLSGKTFYQGGAKRTGTMANRGTYNITPGTTNKTIPAGYHNGSGVVYGDADLVASNIKRGVTIFGVAGSLTPLEGIGQIMWRACSGLSFVIGYRMRSSSTDRPIICYQSSMIYIPTYCSTDEDENAVVTDSPVDLTNVSKIRADLVCSLGSNPSASEHYMIVSTSKTGRYTTYNARVSVSTDTRQWFELDVSSLSGSYYLRFHVYKNSYGSFPSLRVYEIQFMY